MVQLVATCVVITDGEAARNVGGVLCLCNWGIIGMQYRCLGLIFVYSAVPQAEDRCDI